MKLKPNEIYHIYNRGNNKQPIFFTEENYRYFLKKVRKYLVPYCDILAYSLMPNHFHFMIHANENTIIPFRKTHRRKWSRRKPVIKLTMFSWALQQLLSSYSKAINTEFHRTGSLFQQNTKARQTSCDLISHDYSVWCFRYIHNNACTAGLVNCPEDYEFTSYRDFLENRQDSICNIPLATKLLCLEENEIFNTLQIEIPSEILSLFYK